MIFQHLRLQLILLETSNSDRFDGSMVTLAVMETEMVSVSGGVNAPSPLRCHLPSLHSISGSLGHDLLWKGPIFHSIRD